MKYLAKTKLSLYLKMGRELVQFIEIGKYFESTTFDWVRISGDFENSKLELVRSFDEGNEYHCDVASFSTVAEIDPKEVRVFSGNLEECISWLESEFGGSRERFLEVEMLNYEYKKYSQHYS